MPKPSAEMPAEPTFMHPAYMPWALVSELYWMSYKLLDHRLHHLDVSAAQARVLVVLHYATEPIKPSAVATILFQETNSLTGILHRLESRGWLERAPDEVDHRVVGLSLTDAGRELTAEIVAIMGDLYEEMFDASLSATERQHVEAGLRKVRATAFKLPETDFKLRRAQRYRIWSD